MAEARRKLSAGGVVVAGQRVLLLHKRLPPEFRLPKGGVEPGESAAVAALREVAEETGFADLVVTADLGCRDVDLRGVEGWSIWPQHFFLMRLNSYRRQPRDVRDAKRFGVHWFSFEAALEQISFAAERQVLRAAIAASESSWDEQQE